MNIDSIKTLYELVSDSKYQPILELSVISLILILIASLIIKVAYIQSNKMFYRDSLKLLRRLLNSLNDALKSPYDNVNPRLSKIGNYFGVISLYSLSVALLMYGISYGILLVLNENLGAMANLVIAVITFVMFIGARIYKVQAERLLFKTRQV